MRYLIAFGLALAVFAAPVTQVNTAHAAGHGSHKGGKGPRKVTCCWN